MGSIVGSDYCGTPRNTGKNDPTPSPSSLAPHKRECGWFKGFNTLAVTRVRLRCRVYGRECCCTRGLTPCITHARRQHTLLGAKHCFFFPFSLDDNGESTKRRETRYKWKRHHLQRPLQNHRFRLCVCPVSPQGMAWRKPASKIVPGGVLS